MNTENIKFEVAQNITFAIGVRKEFSLDWQTEDMIDAPSQIPYGGTFSIVSDGVTHIYGRGHCCAKQHRYPVEAPIVKKGGRRSGSGRKPIDSDKSVVTTIRLTHQQKIKLNSLGGGQWVRQQLDMFK